MIEISGLGIAFGSQWVFRDLNLRVADGESLVVIGPSGSGKSLLLKLIAGLLEPGEGRVSVASPDIGMLFQKNALFDSLSVEENLLFPMRERAGLTGAPARERAGRLLASVGLQGCERLFPSEISGGMQKRLGIARAIAVKPRILLYDEPTAGLDPITSRTIADLIRQLRADEGSTIMTVTNDVQRAYQIGDRICLLSRGKLLEGGTPAQVQATSDPALRQFIYGLKSGPLTSGLA